MAPSSSSKPKLTSTYDLPEENPFSKSSKPKVARKQNIMKNGNAGNSSNKVSTSTELDPSLPTPPPALFR